MEFEIKYSVPDTAHLDAILSDPQILAVSGSELHEISMETTYFDTPEGMLSDRKWTLRRRLENGISVITCKTPAEGYARNEWDCEADDPFAACADLIAQGAPALLAEVKALVPVCGARFTRRAMLLCLDGCTAELALDRGILFRGETQCPLCELELELKSGDGEALLAFAAQLRDAHNLCEEPRSKFARARSL